MKGVVVLLLVLGPACSSSSSSGRLEAGADRLVPPTDAGDASDGSDGVDRVDRVDSSDGADATDGGVDAGGETIEPYQVAWSPLHSCAWRSHGPISCWGSNQGGELGSGDTNPSSVPVRVQGLEDVKLVRTGSGNPSYGSHTCAIDGAGGLWCWGFNDNGQLGVGAGDFDNRSLPTPVVGITDVVDVQLGDTHTCALDSHGAVWCWGDYSSAQLGVRESGPQELPERLVTAHDAVELAVGENHGCLRTAAGLVRCWGANVRGEVGTGDTLAVFTPVMVAGVSGAIQILAGGSFSCAMTADHRVLCWGDSRFTDSLPPVTASRFIPLPIGGLPANLVSLGAHTSFALDAAGQVWCWGPLFSNTDPLDGRPIVGFDGVVNLSGFCGGRAAGDVRCFGVADHSQLGDGTLQKSYDPVPVPRPVLLERPADGWPRGGACVVDSDCASGHCADHVCCDSACVGGCEFCAHVDSPGSFKVVYEPGTCVAVRGTPLGGRPACAGGGTLCAGTCNESKRDACAYPDHTACGPSACADGADGDPPVCDGAGGCQPRTTGTACASGTCAGATVCAYRARAIAAGDDHACAVMDAGPYTGQVRCWGVNANGTLGLGDTLTRGDQPGEMGPALPAVDLGAGRTATALAAGGQATCALLGGGRLKCWGANGGVLGLGDTMNRGDGPGEMGDALPDLDLGTGRTATALSVAGQVACALLDAGHVKCWGLNSGGALGLGDTMNRGDGPGEMGDALPDVDLGSGRTAIAVATSGLSTCALLDDGQVKCWGYNGDGELGLGDTLNRGDAPGQMGDALPEVDLGAGRRATAITVGGGWACALLDGGRVKCWGYNGDGELGLGDANNRGDEPGEMGDALPEVDLGAGRSAVAIAAGGGSTCALLDGGQLKCWGYNAVGELGLGDTRQRGSAPGDMGDALSAVDLGTGATVGAIAVSGYFACAVLTSGLVKCWGGSRYGALGLGDPSSRGNMPGQMGDALPAVDLGP